MSHETKVYYGFGDSPVSLVSLSAKFGINHKTVKGRHAKLKHPRRVFSWLFASRSEWLKHYKAFKGEVAPEVETKENKKKCEKSGRQPITVMFEGEVVKLFEIAISKGTPTGRALRRWNAAGRPFEVTEELFTRPSNSNTCKQFYTVDGETMTAKQISEKFKIATATFNNKKARDGRTAYTSDELISYREEISKKKKKTKESSKWKRGPSVEPLFGHDLPPEQKSLLRLMSCFG